MLRLKWDKTRTIYYSLAFLMVGIMLIFSYARVFDEFEYSTLDFRYIARPPLSVGEDIVIVEVGDDSIEKLGKWPFPRNYHALMVKALSSAGARTILFDIFFSEPKKEDRVFAEAVEDAGNVYIPYVLEIDRSHPEHTHLKAEGYAAELVAPLKGAAKETGFVNVMPDTDGKVRRIPPFIEYEGRYHPQITFLMAVNDMGYSEEDIDIVPGKHIIIGGEKYIPLEDDSSILIQYPDTWGSAFRHYSYVDILQSYLADLTGQEATVDLSELKDTVCFIGVTATAAPDAHPSPMEPIYPGVGVHTSLYNSILEGTALTRLGRVWNMVIVFVLFVLTAILTIRSKKRFALLSVLMLMMLYFLVSLVLFWPVGIWVDLFYPLVVIMAVYFIFTLKKYVTEIQKREMLEKELDIAKGIQQSFLPAELPEAESLKIAVRMITAKQVGGDLYDAVRLDDENIGVMCGDVSGKGVPAALFMSRVVSVFKTNITVGTPCEVLAKVNEVLSSDNTSGLFVTMTYQVFNLRKNTTEFAIGGHMPTMMIEPSGNVEFLDVEEGMPMGMIEWADFAPGERAYAPGSIFVLYSDGVTEAMDMDNNMFGEDRLRKLGERLAGRSPGEVVEAIHSAVSGFAGQAPQHDDITVMAIKT